MKSSGHALLCAILPALLLAGCQSAPRTHSTRAAIPRLSGPVVIDGLLTEPCYKRQPLVDHFRVAGDPTRTPQRTKAWLFWEPTRLIFAFDVVDSDIVASARSGQERDVDAQDRVELFLWSGRTNETYYCLEIGARGAVHEYAARFYRQFDDSWSPAGWNYLVSSTPRGYTVEGELSRASLAAMGFTLAPGSTFRLGLFRADFRSGAPSDPTWICWVDAHGPQPDFHVAQSFGEATLSRKTE